MAGTVKTIEITYLYANVLGTATFKQTEGIELPPARGEAQAFLLSFPDRLKAGEQVVGFGVHAYHGQILAVNKVPFDWGINLLAGSTGVRVDRGS